MHPSDSFYALCTLIDSHVPPRSRGLVALVRLGGSSSIARGGNGRPCVLNVLANLCDDVRANCDIPAILQALGALGCASSLEYLFETLRDHPHPVTLVFERSGTGILLHDAEAGGGECSACSNPATDSPVPLALTIKLNGPPDACRAHNTQYVADNNLGAGHQLQTVNGAEHARELLSAPLTLSLFRT